MSWKQLFSGTSHEAFRALEADGTIKARTKDAEAQTRYLWFSGDFSDAAEYAGTNPRGVTGETKIVLDISVPEDEIEDTWAEKTGYSDTTLTRDFQHPEYFRADSYSASWVEGYWKIDELPMGIPRKEDFQYVTLEK
ncbi:hypothetical protein [Candidatus Nanohalobium constans]|uniref:Uncharacterized protein n=1 Tax=Candidatus Nanohalobium constans TaxID=2565781 RepID=A0A5Q0UH18_9ARCH|nr:hypothetical protein [Candidatus Nanohalobium constans]QGA80245.1 hypothetical protein LC1Nh_0344 [Candidatus Nanohalobium constans]